MSGIVFNNCSGATGSGSTPVITTGTSNPPYAATAEKDGTTTLQFQSVSCMPQYIGYSFEVRRFYHRCRGCAKIITFRNCESKIMLKAERQRPRPLALSVKQRLVPHNPLLIQVYLVSKLPNSRPITSSVVAPPELQQLQRLAHSVLKIMLNLQHRLPPHCLEELEPLARHNLNNSHNKQTLLEAERACLDSPPNNHSSKIASLAVEGRSATLLTNLHPLALVIMLFFAF